MAEIKSLMFSVLFILAIFSFGLGLYSFSMQRGGWSNQYPSTFNQTALYLNSTTSLTQTMANRTSTVGETPVSTDWTATYGVVLTTGIQALTLPMNMVNLLIAMIQDLFQTQIGVMLPAWFLQIAILFLSLTIILGILAAVVKWPL